MSFTRWRSLVDGTQINVGATIPENIVDNFELDPEQTGADDPFGVWLEGDDPVDRYPLEFGQTGTFEFLETSDARDGQRVLRNNTDSGEIVSLPGDGLNYYPQKGDVFEAWLKNHDSGDFQRAMFLFGASNNESWYGVQVNEPDNVFRISKDGDGGGDALAESSVTIGTEWYRVVVEWHDGGGSESDNEIVATLFDDSGSELEQLSVNDDEYESNRGVGWTNTDGSAEVRYDGAYKIGEVGE